jgi:hypothetical protein
MPLGAPPSRPAPSPPCLFPFSVWSITEPEMAAPFSLPLPHSQSTMVASLMASMASAVGLSLPQCSLCYLLPSIKLYVALQGSGSWPLELAHALASSCRSALQSTPCSSTSSSTARSHAAIRSLPATTPRTSSTPPRRPSLPVPSPDVPDPPSQSPLPARRPCAEKFAITKVHSCGFNEMEA